MIIKFKEPKGINKYLGLMFRTRKTKPLLFEFDEDVHMKIHSYFVFFSFRIIWFDKDDKIIEEGIVKPFTASVKCSKSYRKFVEIPLA